MKKKFFLCLFILSLVLTLFSGCNLNSGNLTETQTGPRTYTHFCFDTVCQITIYSAYTEKEQDIANACFQICDKYDQLWNKHNKNSEIFKINSTSSDYVKISKESLKLINDSIYYSTLSGGAFDITISPVVDLWDINKNPHIPGKKEIQNLLKFVNYKDIHVKKNKIKLSKKEQSIDFGGIAKGYVADKLKNFLKSKKINSAIINLGGNILTIGNHDKKDFKIGIQKPFGESNNDYSATIHIQDKSVVTSGVYERYFKENSKIYHHILDPKTGYPCDNELYSVTIISDYSEEGDALSTATFVLGLEKGLDFINKLHDIYAVFITKDYSIHLSEGLHMSDNHEISIIQ